MASIFGFPSTVARLYRATINPPKSGAKSENAIRFGILGAAIIAPFALINPALSSADVVVVGVAARSKEKATKFAKKHGIPRVFDSYDDLIASDEIDAIYNPLPNGLHHEWTLKCIAAGKHVLLEKPSASNEQQSQEIFAAAKEKGVVVLEAFHYRFHPALHEYAYELRKLVDEAGGPSELERVDANNSLAFQPFGDDNIRLNYGLAGGLLMDMGCYAVSAVAYSCRAAGAVDTDPKTWSQGVKVKKAEMQLFEPKNNRGKGVHCDEQGKPAVDLHDHVEYAIPRAGAADGTSGAEPIRCSLQVGLKLKSKVPPYDVGVTATLRDGTSVHLFQFPLPTLYHYLAITYRGASAKRAGVKDGHKKTFKAYVQDPKHADDETMKKAAWGGKWDVGTGEAWWLTYRWQLEAFVQAIKQFRNGVPAHKARGSVWVEADESVAFMHIIDAIYDKAGLPRRT